MYRVTNSRNLSSRVSRRRLTMALLCSSVSGLSRNRARLWKTRGYSRRPTTSNHPQRTGSGPVDRISTIPELYLYGRPETAWHTWSRDVRTRPDLAASSESGPVTIIELAGEREASRSILFRPGQLSNCPAFIPQYSVVRPVVGSPNPIGMLTTFWFPPARCVRPAMWRGRARVTWQAVRHRRRSAALMRSRGCKEWA